MRATINYCCAGLLLLTSIASDAANSQSHQSANDQVNGCANTNLYRQTSEEQRKTAVTPNDDLVLLSKHYCVGFTDLSTVKSSSLPTKMSNIEALVMFGRYNKVWRALSTTEEKVMFAHLYLKQLSKKALILPQTIQADKISIVLPAALGRDKVILVQHNLSVTLADYLVVHQGLLDLTYLSSKQLKTMEGQSTKLAKQVKWVMKGNGEGSFDLDQPINSIIESTTGDCTLLEGGCKDRSAQEYNDWLYDVFDEEQEMCDIYYKYCVVSWGSRDSYGYQCIEVLYLDDGHIVTGFYCKHKDDPEDP
jgi:hypothetical protein